MLVESNTVFVGLKTVLGIWDHLQKKTTVFFIFQQNSDMFFDTIPVRSKSSGGPIELIPH